MKISGVLCLLSGAVFISGGAALLSYDPDSSFLWYGLIVIGSIFVLAGALFVAVARKLATAAGDEPS